MLSSGQGRRCMPCANLVRQRHGNAFAVADRRTPATIGCSMGFFVRGGSRERAPMVWFNHCGAAGAWCEMAVVDMCHEHGFEMRQFTASFAFDQGQRMREGETPWNIFQSGLLFGEPMRLWAQAFDLGMRHPEARLADESEVLTQLGFFHRGPIEERIWRSVDEALLCLERGFDQAYARLDLEDRRSQLAGTRQALSGWFSRPR